MKASRGLSFPPRQAFNSFHNTSPKSHPLNMDTMIPQLPSRFHTHPSSVSLTDLQVDLVAKKVFILVAEHDGHLRAVHNLL